MFNQSKISKIRKKYIYKIRKYQQRNQNSTFHFLEQDYKFPAFKDQSSFLLGHMFSQLNIKICSCFFFQKIEPEVEVTEKKDKDYKPHGIISRQQIKPPQEKFSRRSKRFANSSDSSVKQEDCKDDCEADCKDSIKKEPTPVVKTEEKNGTKPKVSPAKENGSKGKASKVKEEKDKENSRELKKLQFLGPGPKMAICNTKESNKKVNKTRGIKMTYEFDPVSNRTSKSCGFASQKITKNIYIFFSWRSTFATCVRKETTKKACCCAMVAMTVITLFACFHRSQKYLREIGDVQSV